MEIEIRRNGSWLQPRYRLVALADGGCVAEVEMPPFAPAKISVDGRELAVRKHPGAHFSATLEEGGDVLARFEQRGWTRKRSVFRWGELEVGLKRRDVLGYRLELVAGTEPLGALRLAIWARRPSALTVPSSWSPELAAFVFWTAKALGATTASLRK